MYSNKYIPLHCQNKTRILIKNKTNMKAIKKYTVSPNLNYWSSEVAKTSKSFKEKKEALQYADELINKGCKTTHFITDYYLNNECIKNEFAHYNGEKIEIYSVTKYEAQSSIDKKELNKFNRLKSKKGVIIDIDESINAIFLIDTTKENSFFSEAKGEIIYTNNLNYLKKIKAI